MRLLLPLLIACGHPAAPPASPAPAPTPQKPAPTVEETEVKPGIFMAMYRTQVQPPAGQAWQVAVSTAGRFSVELPLPFNDFRIRVKAKDGVDVYSDIVGGKTDGALAWSATCVVRADGSAGPGEGDVKNETKPLGEPVHAWQRFILVDHTICVLSVEAQGTDPLPPDDQIQRFLGSFHRR